MSIREQDVSTPRPRPSCSSLPAFAANESPFRDCGDKQDTVGEREREAPGHAAPSFCHSLDSFLDSWAIRSNVHASRKATRRLCGASHPTEPHRGGIERYAR